MKRGQKKKKKLKNRKEQKEKEEEKKRGGRVKGAFGGNCVKVEWLALGRT